MQLFQACRPLFIFSIVANLLMLVAPLHMMQVYDRVLSSGSGTTLLYISLIAMAGLVLYGITEAIRSKLAQRISADFAVSHADPLFNGMTNGGVQVEKSSTIMRNFNTVRSFIASRAMIGLFDLPFTPVFLILLYFLHFQLGILTTLGAGVLIAIAWVNKTSTREEQEQANQSNSDALGFAETVASRSEDVRAMGLLPSLVERWGIMMGDSLNAQDVAAGRSAFYFGLSKAARQILQISIMAWGAWLVLAGDMSGGMIFAASMISQRALLPMEQVIGGWDSINRAKTAHDELMIVLDNAGADEQKVRQPHPAGYLEVQNISLIMRGLDQDRALLYDISFKVLPGQMLAVVGPSGAGKSTLARIIVGAMAPSNGDVQLDGCLQKNWPVDQWGQCVGYVGQDVLLFPGTVAENIARMSTKPDEKNVIGAARLAGAHDLINSFPEGYMTKIGSGGIRLSGGQKQRIALARALYTSPKLLVLDEPNAHLDREGEQILMNSLRSIKDKGVAIVVIAQRQQILKIADQVMAIKDGKKVPFGAPEAEQPTTTPMSPNLWRPNSPPVQAGVEVASDRSEPSSPIPSSPIAQSA